MSAAEPLFDFAITDVPRTIQTKRAKTRAGWKESVRTALAVRLQANPFAPCGPCSVNIVYFYRELSEIDVDNIAKLIIDSMVGPALIDDSLVEQVIARKTDQTQTAGIQDMADVMRPLFGSVPDFVYVAIRDRPDHGRLPE